MCLYPKMILMENQIMDFNNNCKPNQNTKCNKDKNLKEEGAKI